MIRPAIAQARFAARDRDASAASDRSANLAISRAKRRQPKLGVAKPPAHINNVARLSARPNQRRAPPNFSHDRHINKYAFLSSRIPARDHTSQLPRSPPQPAKKIRQPTPGQFPPAARGSTRNTAAFHPSPQYRSPPAPNISTRPNPPDDDREENAFLPGTNRRLKWFRSRAGGQKARHHRRSRDALPLANRWIATTSREFSGSTYSLGFIRIFSGIRCSDLWPPFTSSLA